MKKKIWFKFEGDEDWSRPIGVARSLKDAEEVALYHANTKDSTFEVFESTETKEGYFVTLTE